jgi:regulator of PEP synthase PpsR (kinase-PPPase family)
MQNNLAVSNLNIHLITDSTGETVSNVCNAVLSQFPSLKPRVFLWPFVTNLQQIDMVVQGIKDHPGILIYTILPQDLVEYLTVETQTVPNVQIVSAISGLVEQFAKYTGIKITGLTGRKASIDQEYQQRMEAILYTIDHDDGQITDDLDNADIILIGVSRSSKTPTSIYLAYRGYKVINIPFIFADAMPKNLSQLKNTLIIGFTIDPMRLLQLRESRVLSAKDRFYCTDYTSIDKISQEVSECKKFITTLGKHQIDVTNKSVEEIAANIIKIYNLEFN